MTGVDDDGHDARHDDTTAGDARPMDALLLAGALGRTLAREPESDECAEDRGSVLADERVLRWMADEWRADDGAERRRWSDARMLDAGARLRARVLARRLGVRPLAGSEQPRHVTPAGDTGDARGTAPVIDLAVAAGVGRELWDEPNERRVALPAGTPRGRYVAIPIAGESMAPLMHTGDTVLVRQGGAVARDRVVVARHPDDGYLCKRVRRVTRTTIELESLAPGRPVVTIPRDERLIVGVVVAVWSRCLTSGA